MKTGNAMSKNCCSNLSPCSSLCFLRLQLLCLCLLPIPCLCPLQTFQTFLLFPFPSQHFDLALNDASKCYEYTRLWSKTKFSSLAWRVGDLSCLLLCSRALRNVSHVSSILLLSYLAGCFEARSAGAQLPSTSHYNMLHGVAEYCVGNFNIQKLRLHGSFSKKVVRLCTACYLRLGLGIGDR